jgi:hypothetical protein
MIEDLLGNFLDLFLRRHFFEYRIFQQLLLNEIAQLERSHLQHLNALAQLGRQDEPLGEAGG